MDKRERARIFKRRLGEAMAAAGLTRSALAASIRVDRSTVSQLLSPDEPRLPNGQVVAELAAALNVSADWLLGLTAESAPAADILEGSLQIQGAARAPVDENLFAWYQEATGYKVRHVPATLPDMMKTEAVLRLEYRDYAAKTSDQAIADTRGKLAYTRAPETDVELSMPVQRLTGFARGHGIWQGLPRPERRAQLERMARLARELYPSLRLYLFDTRTHYSVPYTVFGPLRAAVYIGQSYFVFNTTKHVRALAAHFDDLVRAATVQADEVAAFIDDLAADGGGPDGDGGR